MNKFRYAFTMLELVFVIVILGILAAILIPKMQGSRLVEAADQIVSHIRYTQHLAMQDNKYDENDNEWYKNRWQIIFEKAIRTNNVWSYSVFSDAAKGSKGNPDISEIAINPKDTNKLLTGGSSNIEYTHKKVTNSLRIGDEYGIVDINFADECTYYASQRIIFDYLGRPMKGKSSSYDSPYPEKRLIVKTCEITLVNNAGESATIAIEPETGFTYISNINLN